jgi:hypothetical protein
MNPNVIRSMEQIAQEIISKLLKFSENEQAFSLDFYISATTPLLQLEDLLDYWRLYLPHRSDVVQMLEKERDQLFHWAHIVNETHGNDWESKKAIAEAKGRTTRFAQRLAKKLQNTLEIARGELGNDKPAETGQKAAAIRKRVWIWIKGFVKEAYRIAIRSFFDSAMNK